MDRLHDFLNHAKGAIREYNLIDITDAEVETQLAAGLKNGDIELPEYFCITEDTDHLKIYDPEEGGSAQMGFIRIDYNRAQDLQKTAEIEFPGYSA